MHVYYANGKLGPAIEMCDRLCYNLQRSKGYLDPDSLDMSQLLASLYATGSAADTKTRRPDKAMNVYEDVLRQIDSACGLPTSSPKHSNSKRISGPFRRSMSHKIHPSSTTPSHQTGVNTDPTVLAAAASLQFELLKRAHLRLGSWTKPIKEFQDLHGRLVERLGKANLAVPAPETWKPEKEKGMDGLGMYIPPREWRLETLVMVRKMDPVSTGWVCGGPVNGAVVKV